MRKKIALFGGGPSCLMAAFVLSREHEVTIYEKGKGIGRKFLVAGNGGFNLTNEADGKDLVNHYSNHPTLRKALTQFGSNQMRDWLKEIGIKTFIGSSGRVFPEKGIKPIEVLNAIKKQLEKNGVQFMLDHEFVQFSSDHLPILQIKKNQIKVEADHYLFGLGGASWPVTGSAGDWLTAFNKIGVKTIPFQAANCGINIAWSQDFKEKFAGTPLKNIQIKFDEVWYKGEALITPYGLEGNIIYPISSKIGDVLNRKEKVEFIIDLKPHNSIEELKNRITTKLTTKDYRYAFKLSKNQLHLAKNQMTKEAYLKPEKFIKKLKEIIISTNSLRPIEESISTVGGISIDELDDNFSLIKHPKISILGEMIDWDAPTGGFLLQACFSIGNAVGKSLR